MNLNELGITQEQLIQSIVDNLVPDLLRTHSIRTDEEEIPTPFRRELDKRIKEKIDNTIKEIAEKRVCPHIDKLIAGLVLTPTNQWGDQKGKSMTFTEYLTNRAEHYMTEDVNFEGKSREESRGFSWTKNTTRISFFINKYLQYTIANWAENALKTANNAIVEGLQKAVEIQLKEIQKRLRFEVKT